MVKLQRNQGPLGEVVSHVNPLPFRTQVSIGALSAEKSLPLTSEEKFWLSVRLENKLSVLNLPQ